jgi:hypothetical protein
MVLLHAWNLRIMQQDSLLMTCSACWTPLLDRTTIINRVIITYANQTSQSHAVVVTLTSLKRCACRSLNNAATGLQQRNRNVGSSGIAALAMYMHEWALLAIFMHV